jgi:hypothetical protein
MERWRRIVEDEAAKRALFRRLGELLPDARWLASNTSSVPIMKLAAETSKPESRAGTSLLQPGSRTCERSHSKRSEISVSATTAEPRQLPLSLPKFWWQLAAPPLPVGDMQRRDDARSPDLTLGIVADAVAPDGRAMLATRTLTPSPARVPPAASTSNGLRLSARSSWRT